MLRVRGADSGPLPAGGGRRGVAHGLLALLRLRSTARSAPFLLLTGQTSLLQAGLCQVSTASTKVVTKNRRQVNILFCPANMRSLLSLSIYTTKVNQKRRRLENCDTYR